MPSVQPSLFDLTVDNISVLFYERLSPKNSTEKDAFDLGQFMIVDCNKLDDKFFTF